MLLKTIKSLTFIFVFLVGISFLIAPPVYADAFDDQVVELINSERQKQRLPKLLNSPKLFKASQAHNKIMADCAKKYGVSSCFKHQVTIAGESALLARIKATGYNPQAVAENIAWGYTSPSAVVSGWMSSSGHRANILGSYKDIGCDYLSSNASYSGMFWTCDFGKSFIVSTVTPTPYQSPTPTPTEVPIPTPTPTNRPTPTLTQYPTPTPTLQIATPTPVPTSGTPIEKPWWCVYVPTYILCK